MNSTLPNGTPTANTAATTGTTATAAAAVAVPMTDEPPSAAATSSADDWKSIYVSWLEIVTDVEDVDSILNYTEQEVAMAISNSFPADRRNYLFRELLPNMIRTLMKKDYSAATAVMLATCHQNNTPVGLSALSERVNLFLRRAMDLIVAILSRERIDELVKVIEPMFDGSSMLYLDSDQVFDEQIRGRTADYKVELSRSCNGVYARMPADGSSITSLPLIANLNYFGAHGGFDVLLTLTQDDSKYGGIGGEPLPVAIIDTPGVPPSSPATGTTPKAPAKTVVVAPLVAVQIFLERVAAMQTIVGRMTHYLTASFIDALSCRLYMIVARRLLRMDDEEIKQVKKITIDLVFNSMKLFLKYGTQSTPVTAAAASSPAVTISPSDTKTGTDLLPHAPRLEPVALRSWNGAAGPLFTFATISHEYSARVELLALELALRFLSSTLPKQVQGVNDIRAFIDIVTRKDETAATETKVEEKLDEIKPWITTAHLVPWLTANQIAEKLLSSEHNHIIEKTNGLLLYMAKHNVLLNAHIQLLWDHLKLRHEGLHEIILQGCLQLVHNLAPPQREFIFGKIREIPLLSYDAPTIRLVFGFVISTLVRRKPAGSSGATGSTTGTSSEVPAPLKKAKAEESGVEENHSGIKLLWTLVHEEKATPFQQTEALKMVQALLVTPLGSAAYRELYLQLCLDNLRAAYGVPPSLLLLRHLIKSFPITAPATTPDAITRSHVIEQLQTGHRLIALVFTSIARYKERVAGQVIASDRNIGEIKARLDFLRFVLQNSTLRLSREEVDLLWQLTVEQALDATERDLCLGWITSACPDQHDGPTTSVPVSATPAQAFAQVVSAMAGVVDDPLEFVGFSADSADYLFLHKLPTLSKTAFSLSAFTCLERYFRFVNGRVARLGDSHSATDYTLQSIDLQGVNPMWELALQSNDNAVKTAAVSFLTRLYLKPLERDRDPMIRSFLNTCMVYMKQAYEQASSSISNPSSSSVTSSSITSAPSSGLVTLASATSLGSIATRTLTLDVDRCLWLLEQYLGAYSVMKASLTPATVAPATAAPAPSSTSGGSAPDADAATLDASTVAMMKDITLIVEVLQGEKFLLRMSSEKMLSDLKLEIANRMDVPTNCIRVVALTKELKNDAQTLTANNLVNNTKVTVIKKPGKPIEAAIMAHRARKLEGAHNYNPTGAAATVAPPAATSIPAATSGGVPSAPPLSASDAAAIFDQPPPSGAPAASAPPATAATAAPVVATVSTAPAIALGPPPGWLLIHTADYFNLLFDILRLGLRTDIDAGLDVTGRVWHMLATMPTNTDLERQLTTLITPQETKGEEKKDSVATVVAPNWSILLDTSSVFKLLYSLKIVERLIYQPGDQGWARSFLYTGGLHRMYNILMTYTHHQGPSSGIGAAIYEQVGREALQIMLRIVTAMFFDTLRSYKFFVFTAHPVTNNPVQPINIPEFVKWIPAVVADYAGFVQKLCSFATEIASNSLAVQHPYVVSAPPSISIYAPPITPLPVPSMNGYITYLSMTLVTSFLIYGVDDVFQQFNTRGAWAQVVFHSIFSADKSVRTAMIQAIHQIVVKVKLAPPLPPVAAADGTVPPQMELPTVLGMTLPVLWRFMPHVIEGPNVTRCDDYFRLVCVLLHEYYGPNNMSTQSADLFPQVWTLFVRYIPTELTRSSQVDQVLCGFLDIIRTMIHLSPLVKQSSLITHDTDGVMAHIFGACLFDRPSFADRFTSRVPKCRTSSSRLLAYSVLLECTRNNNTNWHSLVARLLRLYNGYQAPPSWQYSPADNERSPLGYAGMRNPGCVCYMNSSLQQLFHIPEFRAGIIETDFTPPAAAATPATATTTAVATTTTSTSPSSAMDVGNKDKAEKQAAPLPSAPVASTEEDKDFFWELQTIFSNLAHSDRKHADPLPFCLKYTNPYGEPVNISEQMDANEFLNFFFDKVETKLKPTPHKSLVQSCFGGVLSNQIICDECNFVSERPEGFMSLSVQTKGKKTLQEGLATFVAGESLSGSNKYNCSRCAKKVNATKRTCVKTLPPHLIVQMKRFGFDYDTMQKFKLNDAFEFPTILDMAPYTQAVLSGETKTDDQCKYELTGIVVHSGIAEAGHYYSYIRERLPDSRKGDWFEFNDSEVTPFKPETIPDKCFGGTYWWTYWDQNTRQNVGQWMPKTHNAYLLVYDRIDNKAAASAATGGESKTPILSTELLRKTVMDTVPVPSKIEQSIFDDNTEYSRHVALFDAHYYSWIWDILHVRAPAVVCREYPDGTPIDPLSIKDVQLATHFVLETLARSKDKGILKPWVEYVNNLLRDNVPACGWFLNYLTRFDKWTTPLLLTCPEEETRRLGCSMILTAVRTLIPFERRLLADPTQVQVVLPLVERMMTLLLKASPYWRQFGQYFNFFREFALLGPNERAVLLNRSFVAELSAFLLSHDSPVLGPKAKESGQTVVKPVKMGTQYEVGQFGDLIDTLATLVCGCHAYPGTPEDPVPTPPTAVEGRLLDLPVSDRALLFNKELVIRLLKLNSNHMGVGRILQHWCWYNKQMSSYVISIIIEGIAQFGEDSYSSVFIVLGMILDIQDAFTIDRTEIAIPGIIESIRINLEFPAAVVTACRLLHRLSTTNGTVSRWFLTPSNRGRWAVIETQLSQAAYAASQPPPANGSAAVA